MGNKRKILYLVTEDWYFWSHRLSLARSALQQGFEVHVVTNAGAYDARIRMEGFRLHPLRLPRSFGTPLQELSVLCRLVKLYKALRPNIVHHIALKPIVTGSVAAWVTAMPGVINTYTGLGYLFISDSWLSRFFRSVVVPFLTLIMRSRRFYSIVQNEDDRDLLVRTGLVQEERCRLIRGSGVDSEVFCYTGEPENEIPVVLFASRLLRDKGIYEFIQAVRLLRREGVAGRYVIVGDIDAANPGSINASEIEQWQKEGNVEWWGYRENMQEVFELANIVCLPSYREGLPKVLLEAAACGRAIVTTDVPGCREAVIDGVNGLLVPARDSRSLADAIRTLLQSPEMRRRMGEAGRAHVLANFAVDIINSETIKLYDSLTKTNPDQAIN